VTDLRDKIYRETLGELAQFAFDDSVARVFPDMIKRSVPGYTTIVAMTGLLAQKYATAGSNLYDLGCSLGASSLAMRQQVKQQDCQLIAIDSSAAMLDRCQTIISTDAHELPVEMMCADITDVAITNASVVVLNFTLQFIAVEQRDQVIERIYQGLRPGGIMILSEKVSFEDSHLNELNIDLHHQFKRANGYSDLEIAQKREALENFLQPETLHQHKKRLSNAGFSSCDVWFQCFNFASLVAIK
jgi:tRNA (cmo5U34)-methyltransferase